MQLPLIDGAWVDRAARSFRGSTGVGVDWLPPRLVARLTGAAKGALAQILTRIEGNGRWPKAARAVIEVARSKKQGGARLIALAPSLYRLWSRVRYLQLRVQFEARIARRFLSAAPGRGALKTAQDVTWRCEAAVAKGQHAALALVDLKQFYEQISVVEVMRGAVTFGLPKCIALLAADLYVSPRCVMVRSAVSEFTRPRVSILAGCTWAMIFIRLLVIVPAERFIGELTAMAATWEAESDMSIYVDDGVIVTTGHLEAVAQVHVWACRRLLNWVRGVLRKTVAHDKLFCVAATSVLRTRLQKELKDDGYTVTSYGDVLGTGIAAGGKVAHRRSNAARLRKAARRRKRLHWLRACGGKASQVARGGIAKQANYEGAVTGIDCRAMRFTRQMQGATCRVRGGGSSLTARLAVGGPDYAEFDPWVLDAPAPVRAVLDRIWDEPRLRSELVRMWLRAKTEVYDAPPGKRWSSVRGLVGAAMAHIKRIGAQWPRPFAMSFLGHTIDILTVPPKQVEVIMRRHARRQLDHEYLKTTARENGWNVGAVMNEYPHGIDWSWVRGVLRGTSGDLTPAERRAYEVLVCKAFWPEKRRHAAGYTESSNCAACGNVEGDLRHNIVGCGCMDADRLDSILRGRLPNRWNIEIQPGQEPLVLLGLPPLLHQLAPAPHEPPQGDLALDWLGTTYGDGSGKQQDSLELRRAGWSLVRLAPTEPQLDGQPCQYLRGRVPGWSCTVPRAELSAYIYHLQCVGPDGLYVGDCAQVINAANGGVSARSCSSADVNADLWRRARELQLDRGPNLTRAAKTKAHRSRAQAEASPDDPVEWWLGNGWADHHAKCVTETLDAEADAIRALHDAALHHATRAAMAVAWKMRRWPELGVVKAAARRRQRELRSEDGGDHVLRAVGAEAWECVNCRRWARGQRGLYLLRCNPCRGALVQQAHGSHQLRAHGDILWCLRCGAFSARLLRRLREPCAGAPRTNTQRTMWRRLHAGRDPRAGYTTAVLSARGRAQHLPHVPPPRDPKRQTATGLYAAWGRRPEEFVGRYLRLPGGPLHRRAGDPSPQPEPGQVAPPTRPGDDEALVSAARRVRLSRKTSSSQTPYGPGCLTPGVPAPTAAPTASTWCTPTSSSASWTRRLALSGGGGAGGGLGCNSCGRRCRTTCRGCGRGLCDGCARSRAHCARTSAGAGGVDSAGNGTSTTT